MSTLVEFNATLSSVVRKSMPEGVESTLPFNFINVNDELSSLCTRKVTFFAELSSVNSFAFSSRNKEYYLRNAL